MKSKSVRDRAATKERCLVVGLFENDPLRLAGYRALLQAANDIHVAFYNPEFELEPPQLILLRHRPASLVKELETLSRTEPKIPVVVTGSDVSESSVIEAVLLGAKGYIDESASGAAFADAIRTVSAGTVWLSRTTIAKIVDKAFVASVTSKRRHRSALSAREQDVLRLLVEGMSNREIASVLEVQLRTVKAHMSQLMRKLAAKNRIEVSTFAVKNSLMTV